MIVYCPALTVIYDLRRFTHCQKLLTAYTAPVHCDYDAIKQLFRLVYTAREQFVLNLKLYCDVKLYEENVYEITAVSQRCSSDIK